ncbi:MAG: GAF domain-containing sensor histidine kinase [Chloroflexota bacterium]
MAQPLEERLVKMENQVSILQKLADISASLNAQVELRPLLQHIMAVAVEIAECEAEYVLIWDNSLKQLIFVDITTMKYDNNSLLGTSDQMDSIACTIYKGNKNVNYDETKKDDRHYDRVDEEIEFTTRSLLGVPLTYKNRVIGVLEALNKHSMPWTKADRVHLSTLAAQAAVAIENTKLVSDLKKANRDLNEVDKLKNDFIAIASHELRTPLGVIMGYASFLQEEESESAKEHAGKVLESALKLRKIIEDMVNLRYLKQNRADLHISNIKTSSLMKAVTSDLIALMDLQDYDFSYEPPEEDKLLAVDATRISMALTNLMHNAISFTDDGGKITLKATLVSKREMHISVTDNGIGIAPEQIDKIFGEFYQVEDHMVRKHGGLGIGLSICRAIVEAHGGRIWAESDGVGKGATFTMALPTADS